MLFMNKLFNSEIIGWFKLILVNVILFLKKKIYEKIKENRSLV